MHNVNDFLITNSDQADKLSGKRPNPNLKEKLLYKEDNDGLSLSLYLHRDVVEKMQQDNPVKNLHEGNLEDFCLALEGVSHFLYLSWNASFDRCVTILEMELQAEIDKFVMLALCLERQNRQVAPGKLRRILFETTSFHRELDDQELRRYRDASYFAEKYCWRLESDYLLKQERTRFLKELRQFYRLTQMDKLNRINRSH